jgi:outer membrane lipoprotein SlyB
MKNCYSLIIAVCLCTTLLTSCARNIASDDYVACTVGEVSTTLTGTIQNVREVNVSSSDELGRNYNGLAYGGSGGGVLGATLGRGGFLAATAGAAAGALGGALIEKKLKQQKAFEYIVAMENGSLMTIVQGQDVLFNPGQPVYVIISQQGRSRIIARC